MSTSTSPLIASPQVLSLLDRLHAQSVEQEKSVTPEKKLEFRGRFDDYMRDKFIALEKDKCEFVYTLCLSTGAKNIVEAGTSFGVSTIWLALAVAHNKAIFGGEGKVIATENEPTKAAQARKYWAEAGKDVVDNIELREGDLRETLKVNLTTIDLLLLDIWTPMALPALQIVQPHFRSGSVVVIDNTVKAAKGYEALLGYLRAEGSGYRSVCLPYDGGLEVCVFVGNPDV